MSLYKESKPAFTNPLSQNRPFKDKSPDTLREEQLAQERFLNEGGAAEWENYVEKYIKHPH